MKSENLTHHPIQLDGHGHVIKCELEKTPNGCAVCKYRSEEACSFYVTSPLIWRILFAFVLLGVIGYLVMWPK